jgi:hypothetical protein
MEHHVIVICEECGRKYRVDPERILGRAAGFGCRSCGHRIRVVKPAATEIPAEPARIEATVSASPGPPPFRRSGVGLRAKAWLVWLAAPVALLAAAAWFLIEPAAVPAGLSGQTRQLLLLLVALLLVLLAVGLGFGLRVIGRIGRLAAAAEQLASGTADPLPAPDSGDDLDRAAAALREIGDRLRARRGPTSS